jgi:D-alanyl-D-alanine carboxypeptidase/D-alanyl-D-alanine-endopeptidase (penicillin-binding protein 4)
MKKPFELLLIIFCFFWAVSAVAQQDLRQEIVGILSKNRLPADSVGVYIQSVDQNFPLFAYQADSAFNPASVMKVVTTWAALDLLGANFVWKTRFFYTGSLQNGTLYGDLYIVGQGDPLFTQEKLWLALQELRARGLKRIEGEIVLDGRYFSPEVSQAPPLDDNVFNPYNNAPHALLYNFQALRLQFVPIEGRVEIYTSPRLSNLTIVNNLTPTGGSCNRSLQSLSLSPLQNGRLVISGEYPLSCGNREFSRTLLSHEDMLYHSFVSLWREVGGDIRGGYRLGQVPETAKLLYVHESDPLPEIVRKINKFSNNVMSRQVFLTIGAERLDPPATLEKSRSVVKQWLASRGLNANELFIDNGSGLSRSARITPRLMGEILWQAYRSPTMGELLGALPAAGVDGTLWRRYRDTLWTGDMHLKTGTLRDSRALAGFGRNANNQHFVVVIFVNGLGIPAGVSDSIFRAVLDWLYRYN